MFTYVLTYYESFKSFNKTLNNIFDFEYHLIFKKKRKPIILYIIEGTWTKNKLVPP